MAETVTASDIYAYIHDVAHGPFAQRTTQYLKPPQVRNIWTGYVI